jgi:hypothetical protein|tara:strand:- start:197 stop:496 length:300 start_codon:yes stop_codon:yes gene_type:complete
VNVNFPVIYKNNENKQTKRKFNMNIENMTREELVAALEQETAKNEKQLVVKVSPKGCVQVNGIRRFPVTFYKDEWAQIFGLKDRIESFIQENDAALASK